MSSQILSTIAALGMLTLSPALAAEQVRWGQDLPTSEGIAMSQGEPVVVYFIGNDTFDDSLFSVDGFDAVAGRAQFVFVGANMEDETTQDQLDIESKFQVTTFPALLLLEPVKEGDGADQYHFKERVRCDSRPMEECSKIIGNAIRAGS